MGKIMRLSDVVERLSEFDGQDTMYVVEPWTEQSETMVLREPEIGGIPSEASEAGMKYFLEVGIAQDFLEDWYASSGNDLTPSDACLRIINYAINDA